MLYFLYKINTWLNLLNQVLRIIHKRVLFFSSFVNIRKIHYFVPKKGMTTRYYKVFREMRALWLVWTSSSYFHNARALRHTSALFRYNARSLRHRYECAQFTIHFIKERNKLVPRAVRRGTRLRLVLLRTSLVFLKIPKCLYNSIFYFFTKDHSYYG